jgi:myo-inositol-1(or 4)-monophosphatase
MQFSFSNLSEITARVAELSRVIGAYLRQEQGKLSMEDIQTKGLHDYVSYVDQEAERRIVQELRSILPEAGFLAEEEVREEGKEGLKWIIDPLDGTTNYIHGLPVYAVSIALAKQDEILSAVVFEANRQECFTAFRGNETRMNGETVHVSGKIKLSEALLATGFPYSDFDRLEHYLQFLRFGMKACRGIRRYGSAAVDLAYVSCGRFDAFFEYGLKPWDVAAGALLVANAGGRVQDFNGGNQYLYGQEILAATPALTEVLTEALQTHFASMH